MKLKKHYEKRYRFGQVEIDRKIEELVQAAGDFPHAELLQEMIVTSLKIGEDGMELGDIKMMNASMKELRYALRVFYPFRHVRKVSIFGSARTPQKDMDYKLARDFAREIVKKGWMVITGAATGIMNAGHEGAGRAHSFGVNIRLPFEQEANPVIADDHKLINFKYFFTRKLIFVRESDATVLFPGGFGTHDEGFETMTLVQTGKANPRPIICIDDAKSAYWSSWRSYLENHLVKRRMVDPEDMNLIDFTSDPKEAVKMITRFYANYHSMRYIQDRLILRIKKPLTLKHLGLLNRNFKDILKKGAIQQFTKPFDEEKNEPHTLELTRLALYFNRRDFALLKQLIEAINDL